MEKTTHRKEYLLKLDERIYYKVVEAQRKTTKEESYKVSFNEMIHRLLKKALGKE